MKRTITFLMLLLIGGVAMSQGTFTCGDPVMDGDGNTYETVRIGHLCWTKSNMKTKTYADGSPIANAMIYNSNLHPDTTANLANFGRLYTWWSAVNLPEGSDAAPTKDADGFVQGLCPAGWHIPTVADIQKLRTNADEDLHSTDFWVLPNANTNSTGFSEVPGGMFSAERNRFEGLFSNSYMWTDSSSRREWVVACNSRYFCDKASEEYVKKGDGLSVRCVFTMEICPLVTTLAADECDIIDTTAVLKGSATDLEGTLQEYGIMWGLTKNALTNTQLATSITNGNFEVKITGLPACGDTVYYAAFVKQSSCSETVYGDTMMFVVCGRAKDAQPCLFTPTVADHEGNVYNTVQIGTQCWTKENMRCKTSPSGGDLTLGIDTSSLHPYYYDNPNSTIPFEKRGYYYNWPAALDTTFVDIEAVSFTNRRGICPEGWHVPSKEEVDTLDTYVRTYYACEGTSLLWPIAKALASKEYWKTSDGICAPGNTPETNNATGLSFVPTGMRNLIFRHDGECAAFWTSKSSHSDIRGYYTIDRSIWYDYAMPHRDNGAMHFTALSVRCIKNTCDNTLPSTDNCPTVTTTAATNVAPDSGKLNGKVTDIAGTVEDYGFVWGTDRNTISTTVNGTAVTAMTADGAFATVLKGLTPCDTVWFAAFAKTSECLETVYGDTLFFKLPIEMSDSATCAPIGDALPCPGIPVVYDHEGNDYNTVQIGNQCWTKENMRCKTSPNKHLQDGANMASHRFAYYYEGPESIPVRKRGLHYNWPAAMDTIEMGNITNQLDAPRRGICPEGWHVPSISEWTTLIDYVRSKECYACGGDNDTNIAKSLASQEFWKENDKCCSVGNESSYNNATGFSAIPSGTNMAYLWWSEGYVTAFWSSSLSLDFSPPYRGAEIVSIWYGDGIVHFDTAQSLASYAVRCVKDAHSTADNCPTVTTTAATEVAADSAKLNSVVTNITGTVEDYGFVWGTDKNTISTTVNGTSVTAMTADGDFSSILKGLTPCDTVWFAAFAKTSECTETVYGDTLMFVNMPAQQNCGTVKDHENNVYNTVQIGDQCWTRENMRATTSPTGKTQFQEGTSNESRLTPIYYNNTASAVDLTERGLLYNWAAALDTVFTATTDASFTNRRGICPEGWHVPSMAEWQTLIDYAATVECYTCGGNANATAKALSFNNYWASSNGECHVGNDLSANNRTGFSVIPTGYGNLPITNDTTTARFWSSTGNNITTSFGMMVNYNVANESVNTGYDQKQGFAVRCVKDADADTTCAPVGDAKPCPGTPTVKDHQNNEYNTVQIGDQCWMKENMRATTSPSGKNLTEGTAASYVDPYYYDYSTSTIPLKDRGLLYNWVGAMDTAFTTEAEMDVTFVNRRGICPEGWHVPSLDEWNAMLSYVGSQDCYVCGTGSNKVAKSFASTQYWKASDVECSVGNGMIGNNQTGFNAIPAGDCWGTRFVGVDSGAHFWTSTVANETQAYNKYMFTTDSVVHTGNIPNKRNGFSVRCLKDAHDTCQVSDGSPCPNAKTVTDIDGITYNTVKIGEQCWMKENMRAKHFADGQEIEIASSDDDSRPTCWFPNGDENNVEAYGLLYNRIAAMNGISASYANPSGIQGVCPDGWHVPSYTEWEQLYNYVGSISSALCSADTLQYIGKSLASKTGWLTVDEGVCNVGFNADGNNFTGFSAMPAGEQLSSSSSFAYYSFGRESEIWSTTRELDYNGRVFFAGLANNRPDDIIWHVGVDNQGYSVRCLKDDGCDCNTQTKLPTVITSSHVSNINNVAADGGGFVSSQGASSVTERGVCWSTLQNPTITDNRTSDGSGAGRFTSYINNLTEGATYYIRAYATNSFGTAYGREVEFTVPTVSSADGKPCPGTPIVFDHEGNKYNTVQIGTQCWTKENLRTTTSPSTGTYIVAKTGTFLTTAGKMARWYNNDSVTYAPKNYGLLYNYNAAVDTFDVQFDETSTDTTMYKRIMFPKNSIRQGICPEGWHIPSTGEWLTLSAYIGDSFNTQNGYNCGIHSRGAAKALASTTDWLDYTDGDFPCAIGYHKEDNNRSGFTALPTGECSEPTTVYNHIGAFRLTREHTTFWYLNKEGGPYGHFWLGYNQGGFYSGTGNRIDHLHPVRCLKDN